MCKLAMRRKGLGALQLERYSRSNNFYVIYMAFSIFGMVVVWGLFSIDLGSPASGGMGYLARLASKG